MSLLYQMYEEMAYVEPSRKHFAGIVDKMRQELGVTGIPKWFRFLVYQQGTSNRKRSEQKGKNTFTKNKHSTINPF